MSPRRFEVLWTETAIRDLEQIVDYVEQDAPMAAQRIFDRIAESSRTLDTTPLRGRIVPELARFEIAIYRELVIPPYRMIYRVSADRVLVVGVFDSRRNLEDILLARFLRE
ncbi:MAG TPA: type II toxin-antitoxin system RelE/ParE family toxin [Thermoanaerobaculia bacterium]|nr:type II toxin-antitoxin system RelE/ParE family toxin [Thermoanaerobaculia bacterium]